MIKIWKKHFCNMYVFAIPNNHFLALVTQKTINYATHHRQRELLDFQ